MTENMKRLIEMTEQLDKLAESVDKDTEIINKTAEVELEHLINNFIESLQPYIEVFKKYKSTFGFCGFSYKENLKLEFNGCDVYSIEWCTSDTGVLRCSKFLINTKCNDIKKLIHNEYLIDCVKNWNKYFPVFEQSFAKELSLAMERRTAFINKQNEAARNLLKTVTEEN